VQADLKAVGIQLVLKTYEESDLFGSGSTAVLAGDHFQIGEFANTTSYDADDHWFFMSNQTPDKGGSNYMHYANATVDQVERAQQQTAEVKARAAAFHTIHQEVLKDLPVMYLFRLQNIACAHSDLRNYRPSAFGPVRRGTSGTGS
jgi:ABC-type transport system substrate-binding protein